MSWMWSSGCNSTSITGPEDADVVEQSKLPSHTLAFNNLPQHSTVFCLQAELRIASLHEPLKVPVLEHFESLLVSISILGKDPVINLKQQIEPSSVHHDLKLLENSQITSCVPRIAAVIIPQSVVKTPCFDNLFAHIGTGCHVFVPTKQGT
jgi:hypothetical protein